MNKRKFFVVFFGSTKRYFSKIGDFSSIFSRYLKLKIISFSIFFETNKNILVKFLTMKRGRYTRPFLHFATLLVLTIGVIVAPFLASTYPIFSQNSNTSKIALPKTNQSIIVGENVFKTSISQKPRDKIITYTVAKGDTLSTIAQKFELSANTVKWQNNLVSDTLSVGDSLEILPVTGMAYKVNRGDTVYTIAKKLDTEAQKIVDFPFNDFANPETFSLVEGQILIVPDGVKPAEQPYIRRQVYIAQGPSSTSFSASGFTWPVRGLITQFATWYHMGLDIAAPYGTPIVAAKSGIIASASVGSWDYGYGTNVAIDNGSGYSTFYSHLSAVNVSVGQNVVGGSTVIGWIGMTGRTTGPHVHFEVRQNGVPINPLSFLQ